MATAAQAAAAASQILKAQDGSPYAAADGEIVLGAAAICALGDQLAHFRSMLAARGLRVASGPIVTDRPPCVPGFEIWSALWRTSDGTVNGCSIQERLAD